MAPYHSPLSLSSSSISAQWVGIKGTNEAGFYGVEYEESCDTLMFVPRTAIEAWTEEGQKRGK